MVDKGQRLDVLHCKNAGVGMYMSQVQGGDVPILENDSGRVTIRISTPELHVNNFDVGDEIELMKGPYLLAKCRVRKIERPA